MDESLRGYLAELVGSFFLVFVGAGTVCCAQLAYRPDLDVTAFALAEGLTLGVMLTVVGRFATAYFNPAIAVMLYVSEKVQTRHVLSLIGVHLVGAVLAGLALRICFAPEVLLQARMGTPHLQAFLDAKKGVTVASLLSGIGIEFLATLLLTFAIFSTCLDPRRPKMGGFGVGLAQVAIIAFAYRLTGGAANPARWFGPMVWQMTLPGWKALSPSPMADHAVYWAGPLLGALAGGFLYRWLIWAEDTKESPA